jgi:hypothetical protein
MKNTVTCYYSLLFFNNLISTSVCWKKENCKNVEIIVAKSYY